MISATAARRLQHPDLVRVLDAAEVGGRHCLAMELAAGETLRLVEAGNHAQGCIFRDGARLHTPELAACIDGISRKLDGFFIGRYDLRFTHEADLCAGRNFQIIELNGAAAEAASIYDARNSLRSAYATLFRQWSLVFAIGAENRRRGHVPLPLPDCGEPCELPPCDSPLPVVSFD